MGKTTRAILMAMCGHDSNSDAGAVGAASTLGEIIDAHTDSIDLLGNKLRKLNKRSKEQHEETQKRFDVYEGRLSAGETALKKTNDEVAYIGTIAKVTAMLYVGEKVWNAAVAANKEMPPVPVTVINNDDRDGNR